MRLVLFVAMVGTVLLANWLVEHFGVVDVGFGLQAPAAVFAVGLAFTVRDALHEAGGVRWVFAAIIVGAVVSVVISPVFALASGTAFLLSELSDLAVYAPVRRRSWLAGVVASNVVGLTVDSLVFLLIAFGSLDFLAGQIVGKAWVTVGTVLVVASVRAARAVLPRYA